MSFRIMGLDPAPFMPLYGLDAAALARRRVRRVTVSAVPGTPDRIGLRDVPIGATALLLNHTHQPADAPWRGTHAIFVREGATERCDVVDVVPEALRLRTLSLRAFDAGHDMVGATLVDGVAAGDAIAALFADAAVAYCHAHYAAPGCYAARIERA